MNHWQRLVVSGSAHLDFLHRMSTNSVAELEQGTHAETIFADARGRIVERVDLCRIDDLSSLLVFGPGAVTTLPSWLDRYIFAEKLDFISHGPEDSMIEFMGPQIGDLLEGGLSDVVIPGRACGVSEAGLCYARHRWAGVETIRFAGPTRQLEGLWNRLVAGPVTPVGETAWHLQRISHGVPLREAELNDAHNPWEAHLGALIDLHKGCYIGQEVIARLEAYDKIKQRLVGLHLPSVVAQGTRIEHEGRDVGYVCSCVSNPQGQCLGLGYVRNAHATAGSQLTIVDHGICLVTPLPMP
jgi:folate-binding protein YgfZ